MSTVLLRILPEPGLLLALEPEELAGILLETYPTLAQSAGIGFEGLMAQFFMVQPGGYDPGYQNSVGLALAEALSWLVAEGLMMLNPYQPARWYVVTRRGSQLKTRIDVDAYRQGRALPVDLLQPRLVEKARPLFLRGDYDTAVFQAFKEVEVAVRKAGGYTNAEYGAALVKAAFHKDTGPLRDPAKLPAEREAELMLFAGAMGYAKNPSSHRDVDHERAAAARLIVFASALLEIVEARAPTPRETSLRHRPPVRRRASARAQRLAAARLHEC